MLTPLRSLLEKTARQMAGESLRLAQIREAWVDVVGEAFAAQLEPSALKGDVLLLTSSAPIWSTEALLRQRVILERINERITGKKVKKLYCSVGALGKRLPPTPPPEEVNWDAIVLDRSTELKLERQAAEVEDLDLRASLHRVLIQLEKRRLWALQQGKLPCTLCGAPCNEGICTPCRQQARRERRSRLLRSLGRAPWQTHRDLSGDFPDLSGEEFLALRRRLRSVWWKNIWDTLRSLPPGTSLPQSVRGTIVDLCMLRTQLPSHQLENRHLKFALGRVLARAYEEDRVPDLSLEPPHRSTSASKRSKDHP